METLIWPTVNFSILLGTLYYFLRQPVSSFVSQRHVSLQKDIHEVRDQLKSAQDRFAEYSAKLSAIDAEVSAIREEGRRNIDSAKVKILSEARKTSSTIVSDAKSLTDSMTREMHTEVARETGLRVLDRAEAILRQRLTSEDRQRLTKDFVSQVEGRA